MKRQNQISEEIFSRKKIIIFLSGIIFISLCLKLHTIDFSLVVNSDGLAYLLNGIAHVNGDFSQHPHRSVGWDLVLTPFFSLIDTNEIIVYSNISRIVSISISLVCIILVFFLGKKFFNEKYSLIAAGLYAFEPHLNYNSGLGLSEPLFHLLTLTSLIFLFKDKSKFIIISLGLAALVWWTRFNGISIVLIIILIYFLVNKKDIKFFRNLFIGIVLFLIVISPILIERNNQFGDPLYFSYSNSVFSGSYEEMISIQSKNNSTDTIGFIQENGILKFIDTFFVNGLFNVVSTLTRILFPYLIILFPIGIFFSLRAFDQEKKYVKINWLIIIFSCLSLILTFSIISEKRYLYFLFPFIIIFSVIPIQRLIEYGFSTFSFTKKQKDVALTIIIILILFTSIWFTMRYDKPDLELENEKMQFAIFVRDNLSGVMQREMGYSFDYYSQVLIDNPKGNFKNCKVNFVSDYCGISEDGILYRLVVTGNSVEELVENGREYDLKYILSNESKDDIEFHGFLDEIYFKENEYPFLEKIYDSENEGFIKLKFKIFEINYEKFDEMNREE